MEGTDGLSEITKLKAKLQESHLPPELHEKAEEQIQRINLSLKYGGNLSQLDITTKYLDVITSIPWDKRTEDTLDIHKCKDLLDKNHFGLEKIKAKILEYLSVIILQRQQFKTNAVHVQSLFFVGLAGTGKTTFAKSLAEALNRQFVRIPFGGLSSALDLRGQSKTSPEAEPGMIIRALRRCQSRNPVILLDELDRVTPEARAAVMGSLLEILDPGQNINFIDYFVDYPVNLTEVLFVATANNTNNVATAVLDRLEVIQMPAYTDEEKIEIGKHYVFPAAVKELGLTPEIISIDEALWPKIVRPLGFEPGIRSLERVVQEIVHRVAYKLVSGQGTKYVINEGNIREFTSEIIVS